MWFAEMKDGSISVDIAGMLHTDGAHRTYFTM
jgi:hypothetical protein